MLDIIILIFLCIKIGNIAERKGLNKGLWKLYTVLAWFSSEIIGFALGIILFGFDMHNLLGLMAFALVCAFGGYLIIKATLDKRPEKISEEDINNIGSN